MLSKFREIGLLSKQLNIVHKRHIILNLLLIIILIVGVATIFNNYEWYDTTIVKIERIENKVISQEKSSNTKEKHYEQSLTGTVMNGEYKGKTAYLQNKYSSSGVLDDEYKKDDEIFIKTKIKDDGNITGIIKGLKRDKYMAILLALFMWLLFMVTSKRGIFYFISIVTNVVVLLYAIALNYNGYNIFKLGICLVLFFTFVSLIFISGFKKKTLVAIISTLLSLIVIMVLYKILMMFTEGVDYTYMEYIAGQNYLSDLFMSQLLIGGLGAIMDVAMTESSAINELVDLNNDISIKQLVKSGREVGYDIMGTMINIMFFTYICGIIPLIMLKMKNNVKLHTVIMWQLPTEIYGFIVGSIGILLTIPISLFIGILIFRGLRRVI